MFCKIISGSGALAASILALVCVYLFQMGDYESVLQIAIAQLWIIPPTVVASLFRLVLEKKDRRTGSRCSQISTAKKLKLVFGFLYKLGFVSIIALMSGQILFRRAGLHNCASVLDQLGLVLVLLTFLCLMIYGLLCMIKDDDSEKSHKH